MAPTSEAGVVHAICKAIKAKYPSAWIFKVAGSPYQMNGVPDLLVSVEGLLVGLEVKHQRPGESSEGALSRVTPVQWFQIGKINESGASAGPALSVEDAMAVIERALDRAQRRWGNGRGNPE